MQRRCGSRRAAETLSVAMAKVASTLATKNGRAGLWLAGSRSKVYEKRCCAVPTRLSSLLATQRRVHQRSLYPLKVCTIVSIADTCRPLATPRMNTLVEKSEDELCEAVAGLLSYKHQALEDGEIRLLRLYPAATADEPLRGELSNSRLTPDLQYEAVSYVWGDPVFEHTLYLHETAFQITKNLSDALRCFRKPDKERVLWIDAVCINQKDFQEKSKQIPLMGNIYRFAHAVLAWLGDLDNLKIDNEILSLAGALAFFGRGIFRAETSLYLLHDLEKLLEDVKSNEGGMWPAVFKLCTLDADLNPFGFRQLCNSPWFTRMWIVQEVALAKNMLLHFGDNILEWNVFERLCVIVWLYVESGHVHNDLTWKTFIKYCWPVVQAKHDVRDAERKTPEHALDTWFKHISLFGARNCSDPRDHVYALLGLLPAKTAIEIIPDYTKDPAEVYTQVADIALRRGVLQNLCSAGIWRRTSYVRHDSTCQKDYLPSWVPDYNSHISDEVLPPWLSNGYGEEQLVDRDALRRITLYPSKHKHVFGFEGAIIDVVENTWSLGDLEARSETTTAGANLNESASTYLHRLTIIKALLSQVKKHVKRDEYPTGQEKWDVMCLRTLCAAADAYSIWTGCGPLFGFDPSVLTMVKALEIYIANMLIDSKPLHLLKNEVIPGYEPASPTLEPGVIAGLQVLEPIMGTALQGYDFFMTRMGLFGLAPKAATCQKGDFVAFIDMIKVPFLLRQAPPVQAMMLRSPCYVQNLMNFSPQSRKDIGERVMMMLV